MILFMSLHSLMFEWEVIETMHESKKGISLLKSPTMIIDFTVENSEKGMKMA